jgi:glutamate-ammonia-ligase adenylyltransferase
MSNGPKPLAPSQYYTRLTQRLVAALSAPTAEGAAYSVDLRLRPSGRAGPLATHVSAFERYQLTDAWTWEHMAMSRGRPIAGEASLRRRVSEIIGRIVAQPRDRSALADDVASMRGRIEREKPAAGPFDVKLARGGLMDCEFAAQFLLLSGLEHRAGETSVQILNRACEIGALDAASANALIGAANVQTGILQLLRIADESGTLPDDPPEALMRLLVSSASAALNEQGSGAGLPSFGELRERLLRLQSDARSALETVLGIPIPA